MDLGSRRRRLGRGLSSVVPALVLALAMTSTAAPSLLGPSHDPLVAGKQVSAAALRPVGGATAPGSSLGRTVRTLVLFNNTVELGNDANVTEGVDPQGVAYDSADGTVWVTAFASNAVAQINVSTGEGIRWVPAGYSPWGIAYDNETDELFVAEDASDNATVLDAITGHVVGHVHLGTAPEAVAYDWRTGQVYFSNSDSNNVTVVNASTLRVMANVSVGTRPVALAYDPAGRAVVAANEFGNSLSFINESTHVVGLTAPMEEPTALVYDGVDHLLYVSNATRVVTADPRTGAVGTVVSGSVRATALAFDPQFGTIYAVVTGFNGYGSVQVIPTSTNTVAERVDLGAYAYPLAAVYDPSERLVSVAVANLAYYVGYNVTEISTTTNTTVGRTPLQDLPIGEVYSARHHAVYVYDGGSGDVYAINDTTDRIEQRAFVGYSPSGVACPGEYVCQGIAYDPVHDTIWVDFYNFVHYGVSVVNASSFSVTNVTWGGDTEQAYAGIAIDTQDSRAFVAEFDAASLAVFNTSSDAPEPAIPVGSEPFGVVYDPVHDRIYVSNFESGNVSVVNSSTRAQVASVPIGGIPTDEAYDPDNHEVYVSNSGPTNNLTAISTRLDRTVANISLHATGIPAGVAYDPTDDAIEVDLSGSSPFYGNMSIVNATSQAFEGQVEVGSISVGGAVVYDPAVHRSFVTGYLPGTISVVALGPGRSTEYPVTFSETGLPQETPWTVTLGGTPKTESTADILFSEPNGSHAFTVGSVPGYVANVTHGTLRVSGGPNGWAIVFSPVPPTEYAVTFAEVGLPAGTSWSVTLEGVEEGAVAAPIIFEETNGSYSFTVAKVPGYTANETSSSFHLSGGPVSWTVSFTAVPPAEFTVEFTESGLPDGTSWSITLQGSTEGSSSSALEFSEPNGSVSFTVGRVAGFVANVSAGALDVKGKPLVEPITFAPNPNAPSPSGFLGLPGEAGYALLGGVLGALAAAVALLAYRRRKRKDSPSLGAGPGGVPPPPGS